LKILAEYGCDLFLKDKKDKSTLDFNPSSGKITYLKGLMFNIDHQDDNGNTKLHLLSYYIYEHKKIPTFLKSGANEEIINDKNLTYKDVMKGISLLSSITKDKYEMNIKKISEF